MKNTPEDWSLAKMPTIQQIRREHNLTSRVVAEAAGIEFHVEYSLEIGGLVERSSALKVMEALSLLTGKQYTLENVGGLCISTLPLNEEHNHRYS